MTDMKVSEQTVGYGASQTKNAVEAERHQA